MKFENEIFYCSPSDKSVIAVVTNNIPSCRVEQNLLEARKKLKTALQVESSKLTARQRRILLLNQVKRLIKILYKKNVFS